MKLFKEKLHKFEKLIKSSKNIGIFTHAGLDPDAQGSALGVYYLIKHKYPNKKVKIFLYEKPIDTVEMYKGFKYYDTFEKSISSIKQQDLVIVTDISDSLRRILHEQDKEPMFRNVLQDKPIVVIDHHAMNKLDPIHTRKNSLVFRFQMPSAAEIVANIFKKLNYLFPDIAIESILSGIIADTRGLRYISSKNTSTVETIKFLLSKRDEILPLRDIYDKVDEKLPAQCLNAFFEIVKSTYAKNGWVITYLPRDLCVDQVATRKLKVYVLYKYLEAFDNVKQFVFVYPVLSDNNKYTFSLRSKALDVSKIATKLGGGGHKNAAACRVEAKSAKDAFNFLLKFLEKEGLI